MVTRHIEKNSPTQVNADKIGVLVHPGSTPGSETITGITVDYSYKYATVSQYYPVEVGGEIVYRQAVTSSLEGVAYYWTGETVEIPGGNTLHIWQAFGYPEDWTPSYLRLGTVEDLGSISIGSLFYDPENLETDTNVDEVKLIWSVNGEFIIENEGRRVTALNLNSSPSPVVIEANMIIDQSQSIPIGYVTSINPAIVQDKTFNKDTQSGNYYSWSNDDFVANGWGQRHLFTDSDSPEVGDTAYFNSTNTSYNPQVIKVVEKEVIPPTPDPVECTVSYSVDGSTWTEHPTVLTDDNNVICNIPRYIYLKFTQDVEITEE